MRLVKHNAIENFSTFTKREKEDLLIQEMSKAFLLYPRATADVLDICGIEYASIKAQDLTNAIEKNSGDLKMINRVVRISFLVNKKGDVSLKGHDRNISFRNLMKEGAGFLKNHTESMKEATLLTRDMMKERMFSKILGKSVSNYLNMDGANAAQTTEDKPTERKFEVKKNYTWLIILAVVAIGGYMYFKNRNGNEM
jgi:hypothetical protein